MKRIRTGGACLVLSFLVLFSVDARASSTAVGTSSDVTNFLGGGRTGKIVYTDRNDSSKVYWIDLSNMSINKLSDDTSCSSPLFNEDGTRVCYEISGRSYIRTLSGGSRIQLPGNPACQPHFYKEGSTRHIIHCSTTQKYPSSGYTQKQRLNSDYTPNGGPSTIWSARSMDSGLTPDGKWLGEAYGASYIVDMTKSKVYSSFYKSGGGTEGQTCNGSMCPDTTGRYMCLVLPHSYFRSWKYNSGNDRWEEERQFTKPAGSYEWQTPEWSTHPEYCTATACSTSSKNDYNIYIMKTASSSQLRVVSGNLSVPHFWVDTGGVTNQPPTVNLTRSPSSGLAPLTVDFDANSSDPEDTLTHEWDWDYSGSFSSNLNSGTDETRSYTYNSAGNYTCAVRVSDGQGHSVIDTVTITVTANQPPTVNLTAPVTSGLAPLTVNFNANSTDPEGDTLDHLWDWDMPGSFSSDLDSNTTKTASHIYNTPGNYTAAVRVSDGKGNTVTDTVTVNVYANMPPTVNLTATPGTGVVPLTVSFDANSGDPESDPLTHEWDWSYSGTFSANSNTGATETASYTYSSDGTYTAAVRVSDNQGNSTIDTIQIVVTPNQPPTVNLTASPNPVDPGVSVNFDAGSTDPEGDTLTHEWDWSYSGTFSVDDSTGTTKTNSHTYATAGNYIAAVRVNDGEGHVVIDTLMINVNDPSNNPPVISSYEATPNPAEVGQTVTFTCDASDPDLDTLTYSWTFGDGASATGSTVTHAYSSANTYTAHVDVTDGRGGGDGQDIVVTVNTPPSGIHLKINCGSNTYDVSGWERDDAYVSGGEDWVNADTVSTAGVPNAAPANVYKSVRHRAGGSSYPTFTFAAAANGEYTVRLHFADRYVGPRAINVEIEEVRVLSSYDISSDAGGTNTAVVKSFSVTVSDGDGMTIALTAEDSGDSFVAGLEIISAGGPVEGEDPVDKAFGGSFLGGGGCAPAVEGQAGAGLALWLLCLAALVALRGRGRRARGKLLAGLLVLASGCAAVGLNAEGTPAERSPGGEYFGLQRPTLEGALADRAYEDWSGRRLPSDVPERKGGIRGGYLFPLGAREEEWAPAPVYGLFVRLLPRGREYELGADLSLAESESEEIKSTLVAVGINRVFSRGYGNGLYLVAGGQVFVESAESVTYETTRRMWTVNANLGLGARSLGKRVDLRGTFVLVVGSENVQGVVLGTLGLLF